MSFINTAVNASNNTFVPITNIHHSDLVDANLIQSFYAESHVQTVLTTTLHYMDEKGQAGITLPYFAALEAGIWTAKPKELDVYLTDLDEAKALNLESRGKDYATNILSYPSELPPPVLQEMPTIPLGELIICHEVVVKQATEQHKQITDHTTHLLVHGILHLLGFDHELGDEQADEMEGFEIAILKNLGIHNPYDR